MPEALPDFRVPNSDCVRCGHLKEWHTVQPNLGCAPTDAQVCDCPKLVLDPEYLAAVRAAMNAVTAIGILRRRNGRAND